MEPMKKLSIGITVNLENYENLRLEVDGEVAAPEDAQALVAYLDAVLGGLGRADPATARKIDSYRTRVLSTPGISRHAEMAETIEEEVAEMIEEEMPIPAEREEEVLVAEQPVMEAIHDGDLTESLYHTPADAACVGENSNHAGERVAAEVPEMAKEQQEICECAAQPEAPRGEEVFVCSACGTAISRAQEQLSQLFVGKALCKKCMDTGE
ncbi:MAG: hypothetical protein QCH35_07980 [Methanomicrobiaceae archaeon]|nr:hypothetical protein [Methanomicrobiaceae archaeon]